MGQVGVEPTLAVLQTAALPVKRPARGYRAAARPTPLRAATTRSGTGGNRTPIPWVQARCLPVRRRTHLSAQRCGKGSNLQPRPSEGRALVRLSYHSFAEPHREGLEPATCPLEGGRSLPLSYRCRIPPARAVGRCSSVAFHSPPHAVHSAPGRIRTCIHPVKNRRLCR